MSTTESIDCCPKCGGKKGYKLKESLWLVGCWGKEHNDAVSVGLNKYAQCIECDYLITLERATGEK